MGGICFTVMIPIEKGLFAEYILEQDIAISNYSMNIISLVPCPMEF